LLLGTKKPKYFYANRRKQMGNRDAAIMREKAARYLKEGNYDEALSLMQQAAELGDAEAQHELADVFRAENDLAAALEWEKKAAEQGYPKAQYNLAIHYRNGLGTSVDSGQQFIWCQKAAENGFADAMHGLAVCYLHGTGTSKNFEKAIHWLEQASNAGNAGAKTRLAGAYYDGIGVPADKEKGLSLLCEAAALGDEKAITLLREHEEAPGHLEGQRMKMPKILKNKHMWIGAVIGAFLFSVPYLDGGRMTFGQFLTGVIISALIGYGYGVWKKIFRS
jgi:TPR repeat protein